MDTMNSDKQTQYRLKKTVLAGLISAKETIIIKTVSNEYTLYNDLALMDRYGDFVVDSGDDVEFNDENRAFVIITERGDSIEQKTTFYLDDVTDIYADD